jgi:hypothetical protein
MSIVPDREVKRFNQSMKYDYLDSPSASTRSSIIIRFGKKVLRKILNDLKIILVSEHLTIEEFEKVRPWTTSLVGWLSDFRVLTKHSDAVTKEILKDLKVSEIAIDMKKVAVHWRLGDFLAREEQFNFHGVVDFEKSIEPIIERLQRHNSSLRIKIFTDQETVAKKLLMTYCLNSEADVEVVSGELFSDLREMIQSEFFIGSNSGISFWVGAVRNTLGLKMNFLPTRWYRDKAKVISDELHASAFNAPLNLRCQSYPPVFYDNLSRN